VSCQPLFTPRGSASFVLNVTHGGWSALVTSDDGLILCGDDLDGHHDQCSHEYSSGYGLHLTVSPNGLGPFDVSWSGACAGTGNTAEVVMDGNQSCLVQVDPT
jgi:hypothetical protein